MAVPRMRRKAIDPIGALPLEQIHRGGQGLPRV
jgi:hypothetical protein